MRVQEGHAHAYTIYTVTDLSHFWVFFSSMIYFKKGKYLSLTQHLPFSVEHPSQFSRFEYWVGVIFIWYGEFLKRVLQIPLYWENAPVLTVGSWDLKWGQTEWCTVPTYINLCVDTGHLMLGARNRDEARKRIRGLFKERAGQIKHIHLHENDFVSDLHLKPFERMKGLRVIDETLFKAITEGRSFIIEDPS